MVVDKNQKSSLVRNIRILSKKNARKKGYEKLEKQQGLNEEQKSGEFQERHQRFLNILRVPLEIVNHVEPSISQPSERRRGVEDNSHHPQEIRGKFISIVFYIPSPLFKKIEKKKLIYLHQCQKC